MELRLRFSMRRIRKTSKKQNDRQHTKQNKRQPNTKMKLTTKEIKAIPFRIKPHEYEDNLSLTYGYLIPGAKDTYETEIDIDDFNDLGITETRCSCDDCKFKRMPNCKRFVSLDYKCKHIKFCEIDLKEHKVNGI